MPRLDIRFVELHNIRIYDLDKVGSRKVRGMVLVVSDEGGMVLDRLNGRYVDLESQNYSVVGELFERDGRLALITGIGRNRDGSGMIEGKSSVDAGGRTFKVIFCLEGLCVATIHDTSDKT